MIFSLAVVSMMGKDLSIASVSDLSKGQNTTISSLYAILRYCNAMFKETVP